MPLYSYRPRNVKIIFYTSLSENPTFMYNIVIYTCIYVLIGIGITYKYLYFNYNYTKINKDTFKIKILLTRPRRLYYLRTQLKVQNGYYLFQYY